MGQVKPGEAYWRSAVLSDDGRYRYDLGRHWGGGLWGDGEGWVLWVMLNPSTADAAVDDPTIRRCQAFSRAWRYSGMHVANLFALRATDPAELTRAPDPIGPDNDRYLRKLSAQASSTMVAWGAHPLARERAREVTPLLRSPHCLGMTRDGSPRHPLYVRGEALPALWTPR
jgi:hypothetical protein